MNNTALHFFSGKDIKELLTMEKCIEAMKTAFAALSNGEAVMPVRTRVEMEPDNATALFMPVYMPTIKRVGVKTVTSSLNNPAQGLPMIHAMIMMFDSQTGIPLAVLDGEAVTALRTGAVSGLATDLLARKDAETAVIIGTGAQGETQLEAVCTVRDIRKAYVFGRKPKKTEAFAVKMSNRLNIEVTAGESLNVLDEADVVCTATPSKKPLFEDQLLKSGIHINGVGSYKPDMVEIPPETICRAKLVVDQKEGCLAEAGDVLQPIANGTIDENHIHGNLGDLVTGKIASRETDEEITVFKSVGVAVQDLVCADLVLRKAREKGVGTVISL